MKKLPQLSKIIIPAAALMIGLTIGFGVSHIQMKKEQKVFQDKIKEANRKITYIQRKTTEEKTEATAFMEQQYQADLDKFRNEKKTLGGQVGKLKEQTQKLEMKARDSDEAFAKTKKEIQEIERNNKNLDQELKKITGEKQALQAELRKTTGEKQTLQAELKKTTRDLGHCTSNNAELCTIAEELVKKYRNKGLGAIFMENEPLTQINKVKLEQISQQYREEIAQKKIKKNNAGGKNAVE